MTLKIFSFLKRFKMSDGQVNSETFQKTLNIKKQNLACAVYTVVFFLSKNASNMRLLFSRIKIKKGKFSLVQQLFLKKMDSKKPTKLSDRKKPIHFAAVSLMSPRLVPQSLVENKVKKSRFLAQKKTKLLIASFASYKNIACKGDIFLLNLLHFYS